MKNLRDKETTIKLQSLDNIFLNKSTLWNAVKTSGTGHREFTNKVTSVKIEYQAHIKKKENNISHTIKDQLKDQIQQHLNILGKNIFMLDSGSWKNQPNFNQSIQNFGKWYHNTHTIKKK